jgi:hypothetical protein
LSCEVYIVHSHLGLIKQPLHHEHRTWEGDMAQLSLPWLSRFQTAPQWPQRDSLGRGWGGIQLQSATLGTSVHRVIDWLAQAQWSQY